MEKGEGHMDTAIQDEYEKTVQKRDELRKELKRLESEEPKDTYTITITRDRLAYWEGRSEGLKFAIENIMKK
jgi:uncharacterized hydantoinase/oxoprolinase family protein